MSFQIFHVDAAGAGSTLASVLRDLLSGQSWNQIKRLIQSRHVQINGNLCLDEGRRLSANDVIRVSRDPLAAPITAKDVRVVHCDDHLVVVDKPAGVTTLRHAEEREWSDRRKQCQPTLEELVDSLLEGDAKKSPSFARGRAHCTTRSPKRVRAVHRLDRDTSGLMVFARTVEAETLLIRQFKRHTIERAYIAIAHGRVREQTITTQLVRDRGDGLRGSANDSNQKDSDRAVTHIKPLEFLKDYTAVECRLETGKTHQIRIHFAEAGHMLCGEKIYTRQIGGPIVEDTSGAQRQALHAAILGFVHPASNQAMQFVSPLPRDMSKLLERLRSL